MEQNRSNAFLVKTLTGLCAFTLALVLFYIMLIYEDGSTLTEAFYVHTEERELNNVIRERAFSSVVLYMSQISQWTLGGLAVNAFMIFNRDYSASKYQIILTILSILLFLMSLFIFNLFNDMSFRMIYANAYPLDSEKVRNLIRVQFFLFSGGLLLLSGNVSALLLVKTEK